MFLYRIGKSRFISDLSGSGAKIYGGRWNPKGVPVIYTSESRALATLEYLVHTPIFNLPPDLKIAKIQVPDQVKSETVRVADLPGNWRDYPSSPELAKIGLEWALSKTTLLLHVPSVIVPEEFNVLINPSHPDMKRVSIAAVEEFKMDERLRKGR